MFVALYVTIIPMDDAIRSVEITSLKQLIILFKRTALDNVDLLVKLSDTISDGELLKIAKYLALAKQQLGDQATFGGADELKQMLADRGLPTPAGL